MTTQRQVATRKQFDFTPTTLDEAKQYADIIANSGICPENFKGRPNDVLIVLQMGHELGLKPMQALRSIGAVNGMPFAWGDGLLALVKRHKEFEDMEEWFEGDMAKGTLTAYCKITRKDATPAIGQFSIDDAKRAGLWAKKGVWQLYPKRMLQHRARNYAARDAFPDAVFGLLSEDEAISIPQNAVIQKTESKGIKGVEEMLGINDPDIAEGEVILEVEPVEEVEAVEEEEDFIPHTYEPEKDDPIINRFLDVLEKHNVSETLRKRWCATYGVTVVDDLPIEAMQKAINHYQTKEQQHGL